MPMTWNGLLAGDGPGAIHDKWFESRPFSSSVPLRYLVLCSDEKGDE